MLAAGDNFIPDGKLRSVAKVRYLIHTNKKYLNRALTYNIKDPAKT